MSTTSFPLTSPTIILSGLIRRLVLISCVMLTSPLPMEFAARHSICTLFSMWLMTSSAESSMVITLSLGPIYAVRAFKKVVLPDDVPPLIKTLYPLLTSAARSSAHSLERLAHPTSSSISISFSLNLRMVRIGPFRAMVLRTPFTLNPLGSLASTIGFASLISLCTSDANILISSSSSSHEVNASSILIRAFSLST